MKETGKDIFTFKQFKVCHGKSSMKVGVDGVLIGSWGGVEGARGLDVGCGCGLIALMAAQRNPVAKVDAIDIDPESIEEAGENFRKSPWANRLKTSLKDAMEHAEESFETYDFIISNPPFFHSGIRPASSREKARHLGNLSPQALITHAAKTLKPGGTLSMIFLYEDTEEIIREAKKHKLCLERICLVADKPGKRPKRTMVHFRKGESASCLEETLYIRDEEGQFTEAYKELTKEFYL